MNKIKGLLVKVGEKPKLIEFENDYKNLSEIVEGRIEAVYLDKETLIYCNEEGKIYGLDGNRILDNGDVIAGNFIIIGDNQEGENISLTDNQIEKYSKRFEEIEKYICVENTNLEEDYEM